MLDLFRKQDVEFLSDLADKAIKAKGIVEALDGPVSAGVLRVTSNLVSHKIPEDFKAGLHSVIDEVIEKDYKEAAVKLADYINAKIDIPLIDEETETFIFRGAMTYLVGLLKLAA